MVGNVIYYKHIEEEGVRMSFKENGFQQISFF